jgi:hypothetical protein
MVWRDSLHTNVSVARTPRRGGRSLLLVVMRGGSLRAVEEITGHKYEMIGRWFRPAGRARRGANGGVSRQSWALDVGVGRVLDVRRHYRIIL